MSFETFMDYVSARLPELWLRTGEHLILTGCSTFAAIAIGLPLGILLFRAPSLRNPAMGVIGILQTIPSLAMLVFLLALLQKLGATPALVALTLYALLPVVRNTLTGLMEVSAEVMEAARGIGMTEYQQLFIVRLPLAAPVIVAGIRTAAVVGVGIATLSAFIGAGGLGQFINRGLALSNTNLILLGAIPAALLALILDFAIGALEWGLRPERKREREKKTKVMMRVASLTMPFLLILIGIFSYVTRPSSEFREVVTSKIQARPIRIASKNFTEQVILGEIMAQLIEARTGLIVERFFNLGGTMICHDALVNKEIDLYSEYTGTGLTAILKHPVITDPDEALQYLRVVYHERFGARWLKPFGFNNTYTITVRESDAGRQGWDSISDLLDAAPGLRAGFTAEFAERPDGYPGLRKAYSLRFSEVRDLDPSLMYKAIAKGQIDVICAFATDGRIAAYDLKSLKDDRQFFPSYFAAPVIRGEILEDYPELGDVLSMLGGILDDEGMKRLNFEVDGKKQRPAEAAKGLLISKGLIVTS
ncbi:MAG: glycine betaine ABC transporter substrate-binding protein [Thermodesulfobacteriota bacterium]|nr:glycine betaine ABC transporter substrate-binding protein [Thermodesulfobacteriota bacterium]